MTAAEAIDFINNHIEAHVKSGRGHPTYVKIGKLLALDLCKATVQQLGPVAEKTFTEGIAALDGMKWNTLRLFVDYDLNTTTVSVYWGNLPEERVSENPQLF